MKQIALSICLDLILCSLIQHSLGAQVGEWDRNGINHDIEGSISFPDPSTVVVSSFSYDGTGIRTFLYFYGPNQQVDDVSGTIIPIRNGDDRGALQRRRYNRESIVADLPEGTTACDIGTLTVWCEPFAFTFARVTIPRTIFVGGGESGSGCQLVEEGSCSTVTCLNGGTCVEGVNGTTTSCDCTEGFSGRLCEDDLDFCSTVTCLNGGTCMEGVGTATSCDCTEGFSGPLCGDDLDFCTPDLCQNGGTCNDLVGTMTNCTCALGYSGESCENDDDFCTPSTCQNGGTCQEEAGAGTSCVCPVGFTGEKCEMDVDNFCTSDRCVNGGRCVEGTGDDTSCDCPEGFSGDQCEVTVNSLATSTRVGVYVGVVCGIVLLAIVCLVAGLAIVCLLKRHQEARKVEYAKSLALSATLPSDLRTGGEEEEVKNADDSSPTGDKPIV